MQLYLIIHSGIPPLSHSSTPHDHDKSPAPKLVRRDVREVPGMHSKSSCDNAAPISRIHTNGPSRLPLCTRLYPASPLFYLSLRTIYMVSSHLICRETRNQIQSLLIHSLHFQGFNHSIILP
ncbi:hypothetical protein BP00DRAFT_106896 [Aspergillus indologenus CBS 114.80]|uniref:Uncharacterized protein n=1 Tax=Aspergillus indologenus CBS 114.80 TaxID=1450541 RepID=A0A2V5IK09_9EURO|nr:hypothetical protein BP00DRAFT_106896 [Aspergillus indologenus CBS 114.80]